LNEDSEATEEWHDTIVRVIDACKNQLKVGFTDDEEDRLYDYLYYLKGFVAGRFLWQLGTKTVDRLGLPSLQNCAFVKVDEAVDPFVWTFHMLMLGCGVGFNIQRHNVDKIPPIKPWFKAPTVVDDGGADFIVPDSSELCTKFLVNVLKSAFFSDSPSKGTFTYSTQVVRDYGKPIKGFGGTASGAGPLVENIGKISKVLEKRRNRKLRPIDALDIMNLIGATVVAGNVRRSAEIAIFDCDDIECLLAKRFDLGNVPSHRAMSNNSVVCNDIDDLHEYFWDTYRGHNEPLGLINLKLAQSCGRLGDFDYPDPLVEGFNPFHVGGFQIV